jgi:hypothetical protein
MDDSDTRNNTTNIKQIKLEQHAFISQKPEERLVIFVYVLQICPIRSKYLFNTVF